MPISGVVITCVNGEKGKVLEFLARFQPQVEVHGDDEKGHIVAVLETHSSEDMEHLIGELNRQPAILNVGLTYLNTLDEAERMAAGERPAKPFGFKGGR